MSRDDDDRVEFTISSDGAAKAKYWTCPACNSRVNCDNAAESMRHTLGYCTNPQGAW